MLYDRSKMTGFSLVELIVTMAIAGIIMAIVALNYNVMNRKARIEQTARELVADLNLVRSESIFKGRRHSIVINTATRNYAFRRYSSLDEPVASVAPNPPTPTTPPYGIFLTKTTNYQLAQENGAPLVNMSLLFNRNGYYIDPVTFIPIAEGNEFKIRVIPVDSDAAFDCVVISATRTNIGKMEGGACVQK